jgi:CRISPR-associated protein Cmr4
LGRLLRNRQEVGARLDLDLKALAVGEPGKVLVAKGTCLTVTEGKQAKHVYFEDLDFQPEERPELSKLAEALGVVAPPEVGPRLCVVHEDVMSYLAQHSMDVVTRVSLDPETKTAKDGQLWTEESLPTESLLVSLLAATPSKKAGVTAEEAMAKVEKLVATSVQFGGKASVGRGRCRVTLG